MKSNRFLSGSIASSTFRALTSTPRVCCWCLLLLATLFVAPARAAERQQLRHHVPAGLTNLPSVGRLSRSTSLNLAIGLPLRNQAGLTRLLAELYDPASPNYRHWLAPEEFAAKFGPTEQDYQAVIKFARAQGLIVTAEHPNRMLVNVRGAVGNLERAFKVTLKEYQHPTESRKFYAPDVEPSLDLATPVLDISGLDDFSPPRPCSRRFPLEFPKPQATGSGPSGFFIGNDFRRAYAPGVSLTGTGQSVALVQFDGHYPGDIAAYLALAGLPSVPIRVVLLDGFSGSPGGGNIEVALDTDMAISMAPGLSEVILYEGTTPNNVLNRIATDRSSKQISASWTYSVNATTLQIFQQFAAQGQSYFNASGDSGAYSGPVSTPADNPYVTVVGGTVLTTVSGGGPYIREVVWNGDTGGTGGGISLTYGLPIWQQGLDMTANKGSTTFRNLPDVAMIADECFVIANNGQGYVVSGTSIGTPLWAGFTALVNQLAEANGQPSIGFVNPLVYAMGKGSNVLSYTSLFHDTTIGNNFNAGSPTKFPAVTGYDLCTGWGTPTGSNLMAALALPEPLRITPSSGALFTGPVGGPFAPASYTYSLTNNAASGALAWSSGTGSSWFNSTPTNGTLVQGGPLVPVAVTLSPAVSNLAAGNYSATLRFTNLNNNVVQTRQLSLAIVTAPLITGQPANQDLLVGMNASFTVSTAPNALLSYQWRKNGTNLADGGKLSGAATSSLTISNVTTAEVGAYSVILSNAAGVLSSSNAQLSIISSPPVIVLQPTNQAVFPGGPAILSVRAVGDSPFSYQWQLNGSNLVGSANIIGVTSNTLTIKQAALSNAGNYSVIVSNAVGSTNSSIALLSLISVTIPGVSLATLWSSSASGPQYLLSSLAQGRDRNFYGTTVLGGTAGNGTLFRFITNGFSLLPIVSFTGANGSYGYAGPVVGRDGLLYGGTYRGGTYDAGVLFKVTTAGALTSLGVFNGNNGGSLVGGMVQASDGNFYGTAYQGGAYGYGTLFRVFTSGSLTPLLSFDFGNGAYPSGVLVQGNDGFLYGTAEDGGTEGDNGTVFKVSLGGSFTLLHSFNNLDGRIPIAGVIQGLDGNFYGVTLQGGHNDSGTVFRMTPSGELTTLHFFNGGADGANPWGGLVQAADGNLYGTTQNGGNYGGGTIFRIAPTGTLRTIAHFDGYNGSLPSAALIQGVDGFLYGTTQIGGTNNTGSIFRLNLTGPLEITGQPADQSVYPGGSAVFTVATFGSSPVFYQWQRDGTNLFDGGNISGATNATLRLTNSTLADSALYSVIVSNSFNSVTSDWAALEVIISPPHITQQPASQTRVVGMTATFNVAAAGALPLSYQWQFNGSNIVDSVNVSGSTNSTLLLSNITLAQQGSYSVIVSNASRSISSTKATLSVVPVAVPSASLSTVRSFNGGTDGAWPYAGLIQGRDGLLYGTASAGGSRFVGTIFRLTPSGTFTSLYSFTGTDGANPNGALVQTANSNFYGPVFSGGAYGFGAIFSMTPSGSVTWPFSFTGGVGGANPIAGVTLGSDGYFYGTAYRNGPNFQGSAFKLSTSGVLSGSHEFSGSDGANPYAGVAQGMDGKLYGTTLQGGEHGYGTVFSIALDGTFKTLLSFDYANGGFPQGGVIQASDGRIYGSTVQGGAFGLGTIFSLTTNGVLTTLVSFAETNGAFPAASLIQATDGNLYGTTAGSGAGGEGTVFKLTTNGTLSTLVWFNGFNGAASQAPLLQASDGSFYGTTALGGPGFNPTAGGGNGTIFRVTVPIFISNPLMASAFANLPYSANLSTQAVAPAADLLTFAKVSGPGWLDVASNGALSGTPPNLSVGANIFVVSLTDSYGVSASTTMNVMVSNPPPSFLRNPFSSPNANVGDSYSATIATNASDPNGDTLTFAKVSGPAWLSVAEDGSLSGTAQTGDHGTNTFVVSVTDGASTATATLGIYVNSSPSFPIRNFAKPDGTIGLPYSGTIVVNATDPDLGAGDSLTFYKLSGNAWLNIAANGNLSGAPTSGDLGWNTFLVIVVDSGGLAGTGSLSIKVNSNHPPVFANNPFSAPPANGGQPYSASIASNVSDPDFGDVLSFAKVSGPAWLNFALNGALSGTPSFADAGTNTFVVSATDYPGASTSATMYVYVIGPLTLRIAKQGSQINLSWTGGNAPYQVQTTTNPGSVPWSNFGGPINTTSLLITPTNTASFFRVRGQ